MTDYFYIDGAADELIRSSLEEEQFHHRALAGESKRFRERSPSEVVMKIGPSDAALVNAFLLTLVFEGRKVTGAEVEIGWQHQGLEKSMEFVTWKEGAQLLRRINPHENSSLAFCYRFAVEKLFDLDQRVSLHEKLLRIAVLEAERIVHHWRVIGAIAELILAVPQQDPIKDVSHLSKQLYGLTQEQLRNLKEPLRDVKVKLDELRLLSEPIAALLFDNSAIQLRLQGLAKVSRGTAIACGLAGIYARAGGSADDVRNNHPELPYAMLNFTPKTRHQGDALDRFKLRLDEIENSMLLINHAIRLAYEDGIVSLHSRSSAEMLNECDMPPARQVITSFLESPEGEMALTACSNGHESPHRLRIKTPSFTLASAMDLFLKGHDLDDVVLLLNSLGIDTLELDR